MTASFDYVIVGGGSAGCVLAARLSEDPSVRVALLEAGPADTSVLIHCPAGLAVLAQTGQANWAFETVPQPGLNGRRGYQPRGKVLGGSSSVNAMIYLRGQHADYDDWAAAGNPGWAWADVMPWFLKAEHNERGADAWHGRGGPLNVMDLVSPSRFGALFVQAAQQAGYAANPDFNGATQEGFGPYQGDAPRRRAFQRRQGLPGAAPRAHEPGRDDRRLRPPAAAGGPPRHRCGIPPGRRDPKRDRRARGDRLRRRAAVAAAADGLGHRPGGAPAGDGCAGGARPARRRQPPARPRRRGAGGGRTAGERPLRPVARGRLAGAQGRAGVAPRPHRHADHQLRRGRRLPAQQPGRDAARPAAALRDRQAGRPRPQDGVRPRLLVPCVPAAAAQPRHAAPGRPLDGHDRRRSTRHSCPSATTPIAWCAASS